MRSAGSCSSEAMQGLGEGTRAKAEACTGSLKRAQQHDVDRRANERRQGPDDVEDL